MPGKTHKPEAPANRQKRPKPGAPTVVEDATDKTQTGSGGLGSLEKPSESAEGEPSRNER